MSSNIVRQNYRVTKTDRIKTLGQKPVILWLTGLSGSGKSTISDRLEQVLQEEGYKTYLLDGDNIRHGLNKDIDFSEKGRKENIRRIGEVARLFTDAGIIVITAFISPFREDRNFVRSLVEESEFVEVYINCPVEVCEARDVKGLYARARRGEIPDFTGISSPFEEPLNPEVEVQSDKMDIDSCVNKILETAYKRIKV
jgi:adenylylsulfate kinase